MKVWKWILKIEMMNKKPIDQIKDICNGIEYSRDIPGQAKKIAKDNGIIVIVGGSDDLMYCYGAYSYLTNHCEHDLVWGGDSLKNTQDNKLKKEAEQIGLMIFWCGKIVDDGFVIPEYDTKKNGAFSYTVNDEIESLDFKVMEDKDVYCTGIIIQLPNDFVKSI